MTLRTLPRVLVRASCALTLVSVACVADPAEPDLQGVCLAVLHFGGVVYVATNEPVGSAPPTSVVGTVERKVGCSDTPGGGEPLEPLRDGDSTFLPPGAAIYSIVGFDPADRVAVRPESTWIVMVRDPG